MSAAELRNPNARLTDWGLVLGKKVKDKCLPSDLDGILEHKGYLLVLECKHPNEKMGRGQRILLNNLLTTGFTSVLAVTMQDYVVGRVDGFFHWREEPVATPCDNTYLLTLVEWWWEQVHNRPARGRRWVPGQFSDDWD